MSESSSFVQVSLSPAEVDIAERIAFARIREWSLEDLREYLLDGLVRDYGDLPAEAWPEWEDYIEPFLEIRARLRFAEGLEPDPEQMLAALRANVIPSRAGPESREVRGLWYAGNLRKVLIPGAPGRILRSLGRSVSRFGRCVSDLGRRISLLGPDEALSEIEGCEGFIPDPERPGWYLEGPRESPG